MSFSAMTEKRDRDVVPQESNTGAVHSRRKVSPDFDLSRNCQPKSAQRSNTNISPITYTSSEEQEAVKDRHDIARRKSYDLGHVELFVPKTFLHDQDASEGLLAQNQQREGLSRDEIDDDSASITVLAYESTWNCRRSPTNDHSMSVVETVPSPMSVTSPAPTSLDSAVYPIEMRPGDKWLIKQLNSSDELSFKSLREKWLPLVINDAGAFHQFLSYLARIISELRGNDVHSLVSVAHHSLAVRTVNQQLSDPKQRTSDSAIASIVGFVHYSISKGDAASSEIHLNGLQKIIDLRGGIHGLSNPSLQDFVFGVDIAFACKHDKKPHFNLTDRNLKLYNYLLDEPASEQPWHTILPSEHPILPMFSSLYNVLSNPILDSSTNSKWTWIDQRIDPIIHTLLSLEDPTEAALLHEMCRLGICVFLGPIRRNCGKLGVCTTAHVKKLRELLSDPENANIVTVPKKFILWILFFGMLESVGKDDEEWFVASIVVTAKSFELSWDSLVAIVSKFLWRDGLFEKEVEDGRKRFFAKLNDGTL